MLFAVEKHIGLIYGGETIPCWIPPEEPCIIITKFIDFIIFYYTNPFVTRLTLCDIVLFEFGMLCPVMAEMAIDPDLIDQG